MNQGSELPRKPSAARVRVVTGGLATPKEACTYLRVGRNWLYGLMRSGALSYVRYGKRYAIPWSALHEYAATKLRPGKIA